MTYLSSFKTKPLWLLTSMQSKSFLFVSLLFNGLFLTTTRILGIDVSAALCWLLKLFMFFNIFSLKI